jgi:ribosomal protein S18 acetylase RimI-like enzyme
VAIVVRDFRPEDEEGWVRCRVLSFLHTAYFDAVEQHHEPSKSPSYSLVAENGSEMLGVLEATVEDELATMDTIAVHPDHQHRGVGTALLREAERRALLAGARTIDAWTRDDETTLRWYRSRGFAESDLYLHVYANRYSEAGEPKRAIESAKLGLRPVIVFSHADLNQEANLRSSFERVHVCRRFARTL